MSWIWMGVFAVAAVFGGFLTPWEVITDLLQSGGVGEQEATLIGFVAGYTLPLTVGLAILVWMYISGVARGMDVRVAGLTIAGVLIASGAASAYFGLGRLPVYGTYHASGPPWVSIPAYVFLGYVNSYGWALTVASAAIAVGIALQFERWAYTAPSPDA
jgi:hypothetical protein